MQKVKTMMSDLISRKALLDTIKPMVGIWEEDTFYIDYKRVISIIESAPSSDSAQSKGEWITIEYYGGVIYKCSECGHEFVLIEGTPEENEYQYCPYCGADMRGE